MIVGRLGAPFGVKGEIHVHSFTEPENNLIHYPNWFLKIRDIWQPVKMLKSKVHGTGFVVQLEGCEDREAAAQLRNVEIAVPREDLPILPKNEYYWADLCGLEVYTAQGRLLGIVQSLFETGSNDVIVVQGESMHLIPYIPDEVVLLVDLEARKMIVQWDPEF